MEFKRERKTIDHMGRLTLRLPGMDSPLKWASAGWDDMLRTPVFSLGYGFVFTATGLLLTWTLYNMGWLAALPMLAAGFMLIGPFLAIGIYAMSRRYEEGTEIDTSVIRPTRFAEPRQLAYVALAMVLGFLLWALLALFLFALFTSGQSLALQDFVKFVLTTGQGLTLLFVGSLIGSLVALFVFSYSAISIPILLEHNVDAMTAMTASMRLMKEAPGPMLVWAWVVALYTFFGLATMFIGLIFVFPMMGHATWHAYREMVARPDDMKAEEDAPAEKDAPKKRAAPKKSAKGSRKAKPA